MLNNEAMPLSILMPISGCSFKIISNPLRVRTIKPDVVQARTEAERVNLSIKAISPIELPFAKVVITTGLAC